MHGNTNIKSDYIVKSYKKVPKYQILKFHEHLYDESHALPSGQTDWQTTTTPVVALLSRLLQAPVEACHKNLLPTFVIYIFLDEKVVMDK